MATIRGIELASDIYDLEDTQGRTATQTAQNMANNASDKADSNETAIEAIQNLIPSTASSSNTLATKADIANTMNNVVDISSDISIQSGVTLSPECKFFRIGRLIVVNAVIIKQSGFVSYEKLLSGLPIPSGVNRTVNFNTTTTDAGGNYFAGAGYIDNSGNLYNRFPNGTYLYCACSYFTDN